MAVNLSRFTEVGKKIVGIGFNYRSVIAQTGETSNFPKLYMKATTTYTTPGGKIKIPEWSKDNLLYQVELGVIVGEPMTNVPATRAMDHVAGYCTALDMTCKHSIQFARENNLCWTIAKCFDTATPVGEFIPKSRVDDVTNLQLWLKLNGEMRQNGNSREMTWPVADLLSLLSGYFTLEPGDMVLTGTPGGMGVAAAGDVIEAGIEGVDEIRFEVEKVYKTMEPFKRQKPSERLEEEDKKNPSV